MARILPNPNPLPTDEFDWLAENLDTLLDMLQQGNWDDLSGLESKLIPALDAVRSSPAFGEGKISRPKIEQLLSKLELAIKECSIRKEQIAPLVNALYTSKNQATEP